MSNIVTLSDLINAFQNDPRLKYNYEEALEEAVRILSRFGLEGYVLDNELTQQERVLISAYAEWGFIRNERIETHINKKVKWLIFYWILNPYKIKNIARTLQEPSREIPDEVFQDI